MKSYKIVDQSGIDLKINKVCQTCESLHTEIPLEAVVNEIGTWFNCGCGSTLMVPVLNWKEVIENE